MTWPVLPLGNVAETALGKMLDKGNSKGLPHVPYLRNINVQWGRIDTSDLVTMELADEDRDRFAVREGDLLVCEGGEIGRSAIWHGRTDYLAYQKALHRVRPSDRLDATFLRYLLEHRAQTGALAKLATGSTIAHLPQQLLRRLPVPVPPIQEQRRIVDLLEDHLSRLDAADRAVATSVKRLDRLRDAALAQAIGEARSDPTTRVRQLGELARVTTGTTPLRGNTGFYEKGTIPWVTSGDLHQGLISAASQFVSQRALAETSLKLIPAGSLLVAMYGEGRTRGTVAELAIEATTNQACAAIQLHEPHLRAWVRLVLNAKYNSMRRMAAGGVQPNLNLRLVRSIEIPVPNPTVRRTTTAYIAEVSDAREQLAKSLGSATKRGGNLRRSLLSAAFSGRLTDSASDVLDAKAAEKLADV